MVFASTITRLATGALACAFYRPPSVIVTDLEMPGPDGRALALQLRRRQPSLPVLLVSGQNLDDPAWKITGGLFASLFAKPVDFHRVVATLVRLMPSSGRRGPVSGGP